MGSASIRFRFALEQDRPDGRIIDDAAEMTVTYVGRVNRKQAEADARRRFEEWRCLGNPLRRKFTREQVVLA